MALGIMGGGGSASAVKYDAKARVIKVGSEQGDAEHEVGDFAGIFDFPNVQVGWLCFNPFDDGNLVPKSEIDAGKARFPKRPGDGYRSGFRVMVKLSKPLGGEVKEFMSSAMVTCQAVDDLHDLYLAAPESAQGKLPVVRISGTEAIKTQHGTNYKPRFAISSWVDRPEDLPEHPAAKPANGQAVASDFEDEPPFDAPAKAVPAAVTTAEPEF